MARHVQDAKLRSKEARAKIAVQGKPYYCDIGQGLHLGYRKGQTGGRWVVRMYVADQQTYRVETIADADDKADADNATVLDFRQAQDKAREIQKRASGGEGAVSAVYTVTAALDDYLHWMEGNRKSGKDAAWRRTLIDEVLGGKDISKLTAQDIRRWHRKVSETPARARTKVGEAQKYRAATEGNDGLRKRRASANRVLTILKAALNRAWREGRVTSDKEWRRVEPFEDVDAARVRYLNIPEAQRLVNASSGSLRNLIQAALQTGARYGELARLLVEDFNVDVGTVAVMESKTGKPRHIVLTEEGRKLFRQLVAGKNRGDLILRNEAGNAWGKSHQFRPFADACKIAKIIPPIGFHGLRHTWASLSVMNGVPLLVVAKNLGHRDTRMVERHYSHLAPSYVADAIRAGAPRFDTVGDDNVAPMAGRG